MQVIPLKIVPGRARRCAVACLFALGLFGVSSIGPFAVGSADAAVVVVNPSQGLLVGGRDIAVMDMTFDLSFGIGTCIDIFNGCNQATDFAFSTEAQAREAARVLLDDIFIDISAGQFDSVPGTTLFCSSGVAECNIFIPYLIRDNGSIAAVSVKNGIGNDNIGNASFVPTFDLSTSTNQFGQNDRIFGIFTKVEEEVPIPEPSSLVLFATALFVFGLLRRRNRVRA